MFSLLKTTLAVAALALHSDAMMFCPDGVFHSGWWLARESLLRHNALSHGSGQSMQPGTQSAWPTVMLTYGGAQGKFNDKAEWFGCPTKEQLLATDADAAWASVQEESEQMKREVLTGGFPVQLRPTTASSVVMVDQLHHQFCSDIEYSGSDFFYGPFKSVPEMLQALAQDPKLAPVAKNWGTFAGDGNLDHLPAFTNLYLQFESHSPDECDQSHVPAAYRRRQPAGQSWSVRPVVEVNRPQWRELIESARAEAQAKREVFRGFGRF